MKQHSSLWKSLKLFSIWQSSLQRLAIPKSMQICSPRFKIPYVPVADCSSDKRFNLCSSFARGVERFNFHNLNSNSCGSSDYGWMWRWCERQEKQTLFKSMRKWRVLEHKWWHFKSCLLWLWCTHTHTHDHISTTGRRRPVWCISQARVCTCSRLRATWRIMALIKIDT